MSYLEEQLRDDVHDAAPHEIAIEQSITEKKDQGVEDPVATYTLAMTGNGIVNTNGEQEIPLDVMHMQDEQGCQVNTCSEMPHTILPECPIIDDPQPPPPNIQIVETGENRGRKWIHKEMAKDKDGILYYCYTYLVKNKNGEDHAQRVYIKKTSTKSRQPMNISDSVLGEKCIPRTSEKERKLTKQHIMLLDYVNTHMETIRGYTKFIVSRVLQDVKTAYPESKISYGLVKKVLEQQGLLPPKKSFYKMD